MLKSTAFRLIYFPALAREGDDFTLISWFGIQRKGVAPDYK